MNTKIGIFSDIHWGKGRDNIKKLQSNMEFVDWFIDKMKEEKVKTIFFLGDWFDHRNSVNVNTGHFAYKAIKKLCKNFKVYMLLGNHDTYYKNSNEVNSISQYETLNNVNVIVDPLEITLNGTRILLLPWGKDSLEPFKNDEFDFLFGHFEPSGAEYNYTGRFSHGPVKMSDFTDIASIVFSGHYHNCKEYETKSGKYISTGCPLELDWGDYTNTKGIYIIDTVNKSYKFIENNISPKHIKFFWSKIKSGEKINKNLIKNNHIRFVVDSKYKYKDIMKIMEIINSQNPLSAEPDFIYSINNDLLDEIDGNKSSELKMTKLEYIIKYIKKIDEDVDKHSIIDKAKKYYKMVEANE